MSTNDQIARAADTLRSAYAQLLADPKASQIVFAREEVLGRYGPMFRDPSRLASLSGDELRDFLKIDNNKHWVLHRAGSRLTRDIDGLRTTLRYLTDETHPIDVRFSAACEFDGMGRALASAVLLVAHPARYGVWNTTSEGGLQLLGLMPTFARGSSVGQRYAAVNDVLMRLVAETELTAWDLDAALWFHLARTEGSALEGDGVTRAPTIAPSPVDRQRVWAIYVSKSAATNFGIGLAATTWGGAKQDNFSDVRTGDGVFFVHQVTSDEPVPRGFPRVSTEDFRGRASRVVYATVSRGFYHDETTLWPDGVYPWRFAFEVLDESTNVHISVDSFPTDLVDAVRNSAIAAGSPPRLAYLTDFAPWAAVAQPAEPVTPKAVVAPDAIVREFTTALAKCGISFGKDSDLVARSFMTALMTKPFVILTGLSGSGKTQIALKLGEWFGADERGDKRFCLIPVRPDWTGPEYLLGYEDALRKPIGDKRPWVVPRALQFMLRAARDRLNPYLLILDEMNLAHVERYFADVLSGIESGQGIIEPLVEVDGAWVPNGSLEKLPWPDNLFIVGTVNVDETTYMFSPKVLDRASTIEFRVTTDALPIDAVSSVRPKPCQAGPVELVRGMLALTRDAGWHVAHAPADGSDLVGKLHDLHRLLSGFSMEFGHRTFYEAVRLSAVLAKWEALTVDERLDAIVLQKILPRLHGVRRKLEPVLASLGAFTATGSDVANKDHDFATKEPLRMPRSHAKLARMMASLKANQFVSFSE